MKRVQSILTRQIMFTLHFPVETRQTASSLKQCGTVDWVKGQISGDIKFSQFQLISTVLFQRLLDILCNFQTYSLLFTPVYNRRHDSVSRFRSNINQLYVYR